MTTPNNQTWQFQHELCDNILQLTFAGDWQMTNNPPSSENVTNIVSLNPSQKIILNTTQLTEFDSGFIANLLQIYRQADKQRITIERQDFPESIEKLLDLALSTKVRDTQHAPLDSSIFSQAGRFTISLFQNIGDIVEFIGESLQSFSRMIRGQHVFPGRDLIAFMQAAGPDALAITGLIAFLIGITLAFIGALQLTKFGAGIYVADLEMVGISRELACLMTGIVMAGRTGAAYAAELGSMTSNEEIDALKTMAVKPIDFLVLPRILALIFMMPVLVIFANIFGNAGGIFVATSMLDLSITEYITQAHAAFSLTNILIGIVKGIFFGYIIALAGCLRGIKCQRSAQAVGLATTSAVVTSIVLIITSNAVIDIILNVLGI